MKLVHGGRMEFQGGQEKHRGGGLATKLLLTGEEGAADNFRLTLGRDRGGHQNPRHHHNFDQLRMSIQGSLSIADGKELEEGQIGYFPEGTWYGPQAPATAERITLVLQFGGASGAGFISTRQMQQGFADCRGSATSRPACSIGLAVKDGRTRTRSRRSGRLVCGRRSNIHRPLRPADRDEPREFRLGAGCRAPGVARKFARQLHRARTQVSQCCSSMPAHAYRSARTIRGCCCSRLPARVSGRRGSGATRRVPDRARRTGPHRRDRGVGEAAADRAADAALGGAPPVHRAPPCRHDLGRDQAMFETMDQYDSDGAEQDNRDQRRRHDGRSRAPEIPQVHAESQRRHCDDGEQRRNLYHRPADAERYPSRKTQTREQQEDEDEPRHEPRERQSAQPSAGVRIGFRTADGERQQQDDWPQHEDAHELDQLPT